MFSISEVVKAFVFFGNVACITVAYGKVRLLGVLFFGSGQNIQGNALQRQDFSRLL